MSATPTWRRLPDGSWTVHPDFDPLESCPRCQRPSIDAHFVSAAFTGFRDRTIYRCSSPACWEVWIAP